MNSQTIYGGKSDEDIFYLLITGSRNWDDYTSVFEIIVEWVEWAEAEGVELHIVHGGARGADTCADKAAQELELPCHRYPAPWKRLRRSAGPRRNRVMIERHNIGACVSFHEDLASSRGTANMVKLVKNWNHEIFYEHIGG